MTGVTVILPDRPAIAAVDVRGGGPGTRETDAMQPSALVERAEGRYPIAHGIEPPEEREAVGAQAARRYRWWRPPTWGSATIRP